MEEKLKFTIDEKEQITQIAKHLKEKIGDALVTDDEQKLMALIKDALNGSKIHRDVFGLNPLVLGMQTAELAVEELGLKRDGIIATMLYELVVNGQLSIEETGKLFGPSVRRILHGLVRIHELYSKNPVIESENFRNLLLSFAEDMRVILIMIADRVNLMRQIRDTENLEAKREVSQEASYLYAPIAHKLGLYKLKSELEDLSLKYLEHDAYYMIKEKLNATKQSRDAYISRFIEPIREKLEEAGLTFHMKGRTKSIHSIWQKMKKQQCDFEGIYDLFAIRIIIDSPLNKEKQDCWQVYSIITDMYQPNPKRLRDWLSVPKSNGYESLHTTVLGPESKWVEVQIRTERMDDIAERGLAAHWRYKGVKGEAGGMDEWLKSIRTALESNDDLQVMDQFKMELYEHEVFVFTPKGDLFKFPKGATILDFAYHIHSGVGNKCIGGKINGKIVSMREPLRSGDTIEILTQSTQKPKNDWLNIVKTSRAKAKIRLALKETQVKDGLYVKEMLARKMKNRKIELDESLMAQLIKKLGFKETSEFYKQVVDEKLDANTVIEQYVALRDHEQSPAANTPRSAEEFNYEGPEMNKTKAGDDVLVIDRNLKGVDYSLAKCCHPIYGDPVFGFVTVSGGIKIHCENCPNAPELRKRFGYRIVKARWSGKGASQYSTTLRIVGNDDIGIVNNITSIIMKEDKIEMRSINIDSNDGLFRGNITVQLDDTSKLEALLRKLRTVKGVKQVTRI